MESCLNQSFYLSKVLILAFGFYLSSLGLVAQEIAIENPDVVISDIEEPPTVTLLPENTLSNRSSRFEEFIETDRNAYTFSSKTVGKGVKVFESAYSYIKIGQLRSKQSLPESLLRVGLTERFEARLGYNFESGRQANSPEGDLASNFGINAQQQFFYGFKFQTTTADKNNKIIPESAFLLHGNTPVGSVEGHSQIRLGYSWSWVLSNGWTLEQAIQYGTDREENDCYSLWAPSTVLRIPLDDEKRWFTQIEYFGVMSQNREVDFSKQFIDTGLHYLITPNLEVGGYVAMGINQQSRGALVNFGVGYRY